MSGEIPPSFACFVFEHEPFQEEEEESANNNSVEFGLSVNTDSLDDDSMNGNYNAASENGQEDNISSGGGTIDPGNFPESDIDDDVSSSYGPSNTVDAFGPFPESDIEEEDDDSMSDVASANLSFNSDPGSPMHSSCRSFAVSEDDDREEATPLPHHSSLAVEEMKPTPLGKVTYIATATVRCSPCPYIEKSTPAAHASTRELRSSANRTKRKILKIQASQDNRTLRKQTRKTSRTNRRVSTVVKDNSDSSPSAESVFSSPEPRMPTMPVLTPYDADDQTGEHEGSTTRSLCIPILDLCITEDEGYLGMRDDDKSEEEEESEKEV